ncbi:MAG: PorT family protein [Bacteroidales bacterium]|nr:PorT family protein [Bacteroidales bacterium]MCF8386531.1 PorT family protein [Bacteroidales bacterium]MCF8398594.1 PorT family protein [Bacteroidales bacterium]
MKQLLLLLLLISMSWFSSAQGLQPKVGVNFSSVTADIEEADRVALPGLNFGLGFASTGPVGIQTELLYMQKGVKYENGEDYAQMTSNYLELPVMLKVNLGPEAIKFFLNAGGYAAYWLSGTTTDSFGGEETTEDYEFDDSYDDDGVKDNRFDYGIAFGGGLGIKLGPGFLTAEVRYDLGLADLNKFEDGEPEGYEGMKNRTIGIMAGYIIKLY